MTGAELIDLLCSRRVQCDTRNPPHVPAPNRTLRPGTDCSPGTGQRLARGCDQRLGCAGRCWGRPQPGASRSTGTIGEPRIEARGLRLRPGQQPQRPNDRLLDLELLPADHRRLLRPSRPGRWDVRRGQLQDCLGLGPDRRLGQQCARARREGHPDDRPSGLRRGQPAHVLGSVAPVDHGREHRGRGQGQGSRWSQRRLRGTEQQLRHPRLIVGPSHDDRLRRGAALRVARGLLPVSRHVRGLRVRSNRVLRCRGHGANRGLVFRDGLRPRVRELQALAARLQQLLPEPDGAPQRLLLQRHLDGGPVRGDGAGIQSDPWRSLLRPQGLRRGCHAKSISNRRGDRGHVPRRVQRGHGSRGSSRQLQRAS